MYHGMITYELWHSYLLAKMLVVLSLHMYISSAYAAVVFYFYLSFRGLSLENLKLRKDEDLRKGQAVKNQKVDCKGF